MPPRDVCLRATYCGGVPALRLVVSRNEQALTQAPQRSDERTTGSQELGLQVLKLPELGICTRQGPQTPQTVCVEGHHRCFVCNLCCHASGMRSAFGARVADADTRLTELVIVV